MELREVQDIFEELPIILLECQQYYVELEGSMGIDGNDTSSEDKDPLTTSQEQRDISSFLELPRIDVAPRRHK